MGTIQVTPRNMARIIAMMVKAGEPILITGRPGIGKTDMVNQGAAQAGADLIEMHPVVDEPTDYKGYPWIVDSKAVFIPYGNLEAMMNATKLTIVFIDDFGQAPESVQKALMQLLLNRSINGQKISDHVVFVAATNRRQDRAGITGILEPVKSRFSGGIYELIVDVDDWVQWALKAGMPTELCAFPRFRPDYLTQWEPSPDLVNSSCPRTLAAVGRRMLDGVDRDLQHAVYGAIAGELFAGEFIGFCDVFKQLPNPDLIMMNPETADVPEDHAVRIALAGALSEKASEQTIGRLVKYFNRLPKEINVWAMTDSKTKCPEIVNTRAYIDWATANADVLI